MNPTAVILSRHADAAAPRAKPTPRNRLEKAVADVIAEGKHVTYDLKADRNDPTAVGTREMADAIISKLKR